MTAEPWFAVLPDGDAGIPAARALRPWATETVDHHSGRPWLLGSWPAGHVVVAEAGSSRLAVIGRCPVSAEALSSWLGEVRGIAETERVVSGLVGSFHVAASIGRRALVRGSASAVRRIFHTTIGDTVVAASRADRLAAATGADVDERLLALHLLSAPPPHPLGDHCLWQGVQVLRPEDCLLIEADGRSRTRRWWRPPEPVLPLAEGAVEVRRALTAAVGTCTAGGGTVSADLSGGMDSTSLCFLAAARGPARLVTFRWADFAPESDAADAAARATAALPGAGHIRPDRARTPLWYSGLQDPVAWTDEPGGWVRDTARFRAVAELMLGRGSRLHMFGGGNELFTAHAPALHDLARSDPGAAFARIRAMRTLHRWPLRPLLRELADRSTFAQWLAAWAEGLTAAPPPPAAHRVPSLAWGTRGSLPPWATPDAVDAVRSVLREAAAEQAEPLAPQRGQHAAIAYAQAGGRGARQFDQVGSAMGLAYAAPCLDDGVIQAALSVRLPERRADGRCEPVLAEAMRGIVPDAVLDRSTEDDLTEDFYTALRRHRAGLLELFDDSLLARLGLVDADAFRTALLGLHPRPHTLRGLDPTLGCELWLRTPRPLEMVEKHRDPRPVS
ncbi:asparagine synthase-related protein [Streptomyces sp. ISL-11]|uniref:asparagine synthase-related protein n=1 Tax=Streptomyces sp. ISL-11 TaxID=2819174 RepID=UPI001BEB69B7|nr:asparagine synthase-related protein [Streptomyces sp. ISL-11]MBT2387348.1 hypothetical protein [Streptomyces sp. ISL-11]